MPGPKPIPTKLKKLRGNPGGRPLNRHEPEPTPGIPPCPPELAAEGQSEWARISVELAKCGLLTTVDRAALAVYCDAWSLFVRARSALKGQEILKSQKGGLYLNPWTAIYNRAVEQLRSMLAEFGLSPASRTKLAVAPKESAKDSFAEWMARSGLPN